MDDPSGYNETTNTNKVVPTVSELEEKLKKLNLAKKDIGSKQKGLMIQYNRARKEPTKNRIKAQIKLFEAYKLLVEKQIESLMNQIETMKLPKKEQGTFISAIISARKLRELYLQSFLSELIPNVTSFVSAKEKPKAVKVRVK